MNFRVFFLVLVIITVWQGPLWAWGPHSEITQAALDALPADCALRGQLGDQFAKLHDYCWMADWRRSLHREANEWFYVDDYLLFPEMPSHTDHLCPDVRRTYAPYFRRALQALRTETPENAARWIGSILHFTEDTGSPPHAAEIRGEVHSKMENWVDAKAIHIPGYQPQLFGKTDEEAVSGFLKRMDGLIDFSKQRAERAKPFVLSGDRASTEPIVLESALEVSRVVADLLYTLGWLDAQTPNTGATVAGSIKSVAAPGLEKVPAKVMLAGTDFSTLADAAGRYQFHHLPAGPADFLVLRAGSTPLKMHVDVAAQGAVEKNVELTPEATATNLVRNSNFKSAWLGASRPDDWYPTKPKLGGPCWEGEFLPLVKGVRYRLQVDWKDGATGTVSVRLGKGVNTPDVEVPSITPGKSEMEFTGSPEITFAQAQIHGAGAPANVCSHVAIFPVPESAATAGQ